MTIKCPKCGQEDGYFTTVVAQYSQWYDSNGEPTRSSEPERIDFGGIVAVCAKCYRDIGIVGSRGKLHLLHKEDPGVGAK